MIYFTSILISMFITIVSIPILKGAAVKVKAVDMPNPRKVHDHPIPKIGGVGMVLGWLIPVLLWVPASPLTWSILIGALLIASMGFVDDIKTLGYKPKFAAQVIAALIVILYGGVKIQNIGLVMPDGLELPNTVAVPLTLVVIVGVTNAINLSDGLDGLAGGIALLSFICIGYLAFRGEAVVIAVICMAASGAIFGFLRFNTYPATVFMGDAGSQFLGFVAITTSIALTQSSTPLSPYLPLIILGFPILDTVTVMAERIAGGRSPFVADKNHFHHKLMRIGMFHTEAVFTIYMLQTLLVGMAILFRFYSDILFLSFYVLFAVGITAGFLIAEKRGWTFKRYDLVDVVIKGKLSVLRKENILIRVSYFFIRYGLPFLILVSCFIPAEMPTYFSIIALQLLVALIGAWFFRTEWLNGMLRLSIYLIIPYLFYFGQVEPTVFFSHTLAYRAYTLLFGVVVFFSIMTLKFTRRQKGFKATPMDFLILFIALMVPNLPGLDIKGHYLGLMAAQIIVVLFSYEVLMGELRGEFRLLTVVTGISLGIIGARGLV